MSRHPTTGPLQTRVEAASKCWTKGSGEAAASMKFLSPHGSLKRAKALRGSKSMKKITLSDARELIKLGRLSMLVTKLGRVKWYLPSGERIKVAK